MSETKDITPSLLREIRDEMRRTREELSSRLDETNRRLDETNERLGAVEGALKDLAGRQVLLGRFVKNSMKRHGVSLAAIERRVDALESAGRRP